MGSAQNPPPREMTQSAPDREKVKKDAQAESAVAAVKAQIGEVPSSGYTGDVTLKDKAGTTEAALLAEGD
jgi:hypothetical protein